jgi:hypothetical protein
MGVGRPLISTNPKNRLQFISADGAGKLGETSNDNWVNDNSNSEGKN